MIADVEIIGAALDELAELDPVFASHLERNLSSWLVSHGAVVMHDATEAQAVVAALRSWPMLWRTLADLKNADRLQVAESALERGIRIRTKKEIPAGHDDPEVDPARPEVEHATIPAIDLSRTLKALRDLVDEGNLPLGSTRTEFWERVLAPLADKSHTVSIVDRYSFERLGTNSNESNHALLWLLSQFSKSSGKRPLHVRIFARRQGGESPEWYESWLSKHLSAGRIEQITVTLAPKYDSAHDRHIRFSCGAAVVIGSGIDRFARAKVTAREGVNWTYKTLQHVAPYREAERMAESSRGSRTVTFRRG